MTVTRPRAVVSHGPSTRGHRMRLPLLLGVTGLASTLLVAVRDPHTSGSYGYCPFNFLTGLDCPGCGGLRAVHDLTHLELTAALSSNVLVVGLVAVLAVSYLVWLPRRWRDRRARMIVLSPVVGYATIAVIVAFTVWRNTPWGAWFAA